MSKVLRAAAQQVALGLCLLGPGATTAAHAQYDPNRHPQFYNGTRNGGRGDYSGHDHRYDDRYQVSQILKTADRSIDPQRSEPSRGDGFFHRDQLIRPRWRCASDPIC